MTDTRKLDIQAQFHLLPENAQEGFAGYRVLEVLPGGTVLLEHRNESRRVVAVVYPKEGAPNGAELLASFNKLSGPAHRITSSQEPGKSVKTYMVSYQPPESIIPKDFTSASALVEIVRFTVSMLTGQVGPVYTITTSQNILDNLKRMKQSAIVAETDNIAAAMQIFEQMFTVGDMRKPQNLYALDEIMQAATDLGIPTHFGNEGTEKRQRRSSES